MEIESQLHPNVSMLPCPHRMKPPDCSSLARAFIFLYFILVFPRVGCDRWSVFDSFARNFAEEYLSQRSEFPRSFEGFELGFISMADSSKPLSIIYNITPNNNSWIFITPCSHFEYTINIQSLVSESDHKPKNKTSKISKGQSSEWYKKITKIDMTYSSAFGENISISNWKRQEMHVQNLKLGKMRVYINRKDNFPSVYMVRQFSGRIDAFYPSIPPDPSVRVCVTASTIPTLSIYVSRAYNTDLYCATFNLEENLPNFCTAQLRIDKRKFDYQKKRENLDIRRPKVFDEFYKYVKLKPIFMSEFRCFKTNKFNVSLDKEFMSKPIYINIYAINKATEYTDSYRPVRYSWVDDQNNCDSVGRKVSIDKTKSHMWVMGNETIFFNITENNNNTQPTRLLYQGCMSNIGQSLQVFERESQAPVCVEIAHSRVTALCEPLKPGQYRLQHTIDNRPNHSFPVGQIFLSNNNRAFPHLDCNKTEVYSLNLHRIPSTKVRGQYNLNISFATVRSPFSISYYFHILEFPTQENKKYTSPEIMSRIRNKVQEKRNFCKFISDRKRVKLPTHKVTLQGRGCNQKQRNVYETSIREPFNRNYTYALLVYFGRGSDWKADVVQFYSNVIFTMSSEEEVF